MFNQLLFVLFQAEIPKGTTLDLSNNHLTYLPVRLYCNSLHIENWHMADLLIDHVATNALRLETGYGLQFSMILGSTVSLSIRIFQLWWDARFYFFVGHLPNIDVSRETRLKQEHVGRAAGIFRSTQEPPTPRPLLQPSREASRQFRLSQEPEVARSEEQSARSGRSASRWTLHHCHRLRHVRQKGLSNQCDQIWRNFATLAYFKGLISVWQNVEPTVASFHCWRWPNT